ncbi:cell division protein FtsA [Lentilactobacillus sp. SPB1-3]|uniref:Cell division protein FtsA n=1 Tax=Lentilactobacillus terminaliae TaxID=3003483 RepID=A0ACD5DD86_9LACO|nr:cell division protein FtsA [Lentilactobacillus sp. SPB1-3]MCZ0977829.1 cell division protein FtsA [Lentilactobacillus sp. SPB1-3]
MDNSGLYVGLDIGTTSIKVIVAEKVKGQLNVIGVGNEPSNGLSRGVIVDIDQAAEAIRGAVNQAQEKASIEIKDVIVSVPANMLKIEPCNGLITIDDRSREITAEDVRNVASSALGTSLPQEREVVDIQPEEFIVDGFDGIKDPRGMVGVRLEMRGKLITGSKGIMHNLQKAVEKAGLNIQSMILTPLAESHQILNDGEQDFGTIIIDLGGGQTTATVFHDHQLKFATTDPEGGEYITKDISIVLNSSMSNAEKLKRDYGYADSFQASADNEFPVEVVGQSEPTYVDEKYLAEIIEARLSQVFDRIKDQLEQVSALELPGGIVLTGGVAALPGIADLAADQFNTNVRVYIPDQMGLRHPSFSSVLSLVSYYSDLSDIQLTVRSAVSATMTAAPKVVEHSNNNNQTVSKTATQNDSKRQKASKKKRGEGIRNFFSEFFD